MAGEGERRTSEGSHYLNEPALYELLVSRKKAMIDLREDHLSRCVRSRGRGSKVRKVGGGPRRTGGRRKRQKNKNNKQIRLERFFYVTYNAFTNGGEIHTPSHPRGLLSGSAFSIFFNVREPAISPSGVLGHHTGRQTWEVWEPLLCEDAVSITTGAQRPVGPGEAQTRRARLISRSIWNPVLMTMSLVVSIGMSSLRIITKIIWEFFYSQSSMFYKEEAHENSAWI